MPDCSADFARAALRGTAFQQFLLERLRADPDYFTGYTTADIARTLENFDKSRLLDGMSDIVLKPLFKTYDFHGSHAARADELEKRVELMTRLHADGVLDDLECADRDTLLRKIGALHGEVYGFTPDEIVKLEMPPIVYPDRIEVLYNAVRDPRSAQIRFNIYKSDKPGYMTTVYNRGTLDAARVMLHEGCHTKQESDGERWAVRQGGNTPQEQEIRDVAMIAYLNAYYYLQGTCDVSELNPEEQEAYDFQDEMDVFLKAAPADRPGLIEKTRDRLDYHLSMAHPAVYQEPVGYLSLQAA